MNSQVGKIQPRYVGNGGFKVEPGRCARSKAKRWLDIFVAILALAFLFPLLGLIALAILIGSGRPIFFRQHRTGLAGTPFKIMKFRTMKVMEDGSDIRHASRLDDRVTPIGRFLRKSHWDELPQLFNILTGDMTLIGPRPHAIAHDLLYEKHCTGYAMRFAARPGLTGLAQVSGHRGEILEMNNMQQRVDADISYVENWSMALDVRIALQTIPLLFVDPKSY